MSKFTYKGAKPGAARIPSRPDFIRDYTVGTEAGLLDFLFGVLADRKRTSVKEFLKYGHVKVNGEVVTQFDFPLEPGTTVTVNFSRPFVVFYNRRMKLVYEDDDIIVVNKGYGLLSMGNDKIKDGTADYQFIEIMGCPGGCINGGGQPIQHAVVRNFVDLKARRAEALYRSDADNAKRKSHENAAIKQLYAEFLGEPGSHKAHEILHTSYVARKKYE